MKNIHYDIEKLLSYAQAHLLLDDLDVVYARNLILDDLKLSSYVSYEVNTDELEALASPESLLEPILNYATENKVCFIKDRAKLSARIIGYVSKRPSELAEIHADLAARNVQKADDFLNDYLVKSNFVAYAPLKELCTFKPKSKPPSSALCTQSNAEIENLIAYAQSHLLLHDGDVPFVRGILVQELKVEETVPADAEYDMIDELSTPEPVLTPVLDYAVENGVIKPDAREKFSDRLISFLMKRPSEVSDTFCALQKNPVRAFDWLYDYAVKSNYVNFTAIAANKHWEGKGTRGKIEITINTLRPENSDADVEKSLTEKNNKYPPCVLCKENEGFSGNAPLRHKRSLRTVPLSLGGEEYFWQFSPFSYFNQHGNAISAAHTPMRTDKATFIKLMDFVDFMPNYFIGHNAVLAGVGGSVLTHDHFQAGKAAMPYFRAPMLKKLKCAAHPYIGIEIADWYCPVIRLSYTSKKPLADFADLIRTAWENYSDKDSDIIAATGTIQHNAIAVAARKVQGGYVLDLFLRNNRADSTYPDGIFKAHTYNRPIKTEAAALTETLGWFVLAGRLAGQLKRIEKFLTKETRYNVLKLDEDLKPFAPIIEKLIKEAGSGRLSAIEAHLNVKDEVNRICEGILDDIAVFKRDEAGQAAFAKFLATAGIE
ncbi:MAG: hypothetical protein FWH03_06875 [Firmicutes bacterium]|nr:hypothetical protein [Bacillota bacterium]